MGDIVGIFKELREGEKASFESKAVMPSALVKEVDTKGLIRRSQREVPTALMYASLYVTNQRLLFLVFHQMKAEDAQKGATGFRPSQMATEWFAIPIESIQRIEAQGLDPRKSKDVRKFLQKSGESDVVDRTGVELVYGTRDLTKDDREFSQSLLRLGALQRLTTRTERISDKLFIATDQTSLLASSVQAAMGVRAALEGPPKTATQHFSILDSDAQRAPSSGEREDGGA
jgi:hypothetical protein